LCVKRKLVLTHVLTNTKVPNTQSTNKYTNSVHIENHGTLQVAILGVPKSEDLALTQFVKEFDLALRLLNLLNTQNIATTFDTFRNTRTMSTNNSWADYPWRNPAIVFEALPRSLILEDLKRSWHFQREAHFRWMQKVIWTATNDNYRVVLCDVEGIVGNIVKELCNKPTAFYHLQSAQGGVGNVRMSVRIFAAIYEEWHRSSVHPNIEFGHFFASPVRITATGPSSLPQILKAHTSLCAQAQHISMDMDNYSVHPLLPAVILVCDRLASVERDPDGFLSLRKVARTQTVLVILTGTNLTSAGIHVTLDSLKPFALPIERADATGLDVLRVPLDIAINFITELEARIDERKEPSGRTLDTSLCVHSTPLGYNHDLTYDPSIWAQTMRAEALKIGFKKLWDTAYSAVRVHAHLSGQTSSYDLEHVPFSNRFKP
jgi:hypothetical protein